MSLRLTSSERVRRYQNAGLWGDMCLHDCLAANAMMVPDDIALVDAADRETFAPGTPVELTYLEAADAVARLGLVFSELGLEPGDLIAIQLPQIIEAPIAALAAQRSGLVACLLPHHWGTREIRRALDRIAPRAILAARSPVAAEQSRLDGLRDVAAALPSIRFVMALGDDVPDGIIPLGTFAADSRKKTRQGDLAWKVPDPGESPHIADGAEADDIALVTWPSAHAWPAAALARSHNEILAAGRAIADTAGMDDGARLLCPYPLTAFAAQGAFLAPWLLTGGTLALHRAFDLDMFIETLCRAPTYFTAVAARIEVPVVEALTELGAAGPAAIGIVRDLRFDAATVDEPPIGAPPVLDLLNVGDMVLHGAWRQESAPLSLPNLRRRPGDDRPAPLLETHLAPPRSGDAPGTAELFLRSAMTPSAAIGGDRDHFAPLQDADGFVAAGLLARIDGEAVIPLTADRSGRLFRGATAIDLRELKALYAAAPGVESCTLEVQPDPIMGERVRAILFASRGAEPSIGHISDYLAGLGTGIHALPDDIRIVSRRQFGFARPARAPEVAVRQLMRA